MMNRIAILSTWGIGDVIALAPLVRKLKHVYPQARIVIYSRRGGFLESTTVAHVDGVFKFDTWPKIFELLKEKADLLIGPGYYRNISGTRNVFFYYLAFLLLRAKKKITYHELNARPFVKKNVVENAVDILKKLDIEITPGDYQLCVPFAFDPLSARQLFKDRNIVLPGKMVVVHVGSKKGYSTRFWPTERWVQLLETLHKKYAATILFIGDTVDVEKTEAVTRLLGVPSFNLVAQTSLEQTTALIKECDLFLSTNSGPMWIAAALHKKQVVICGPSKFSWDPYNGQAVVVRRVIDRKYCNPPCDARRCHYRDVLCMEKIGLSDVLSAVEKAWGSR